MCHVHAFRNLDLKLKAIENKEKQKEMHDDMHQHLLFTPCDEQFDIMLNLCLQKWKSWQIPSVDTYAKYFEVLISKITIRRIDILHKIQT